MGESRVDGNDVSDSRTTDHVEESSWTMYLGDFLVDNNDDKSQLISLDNNSSSLVSDATSSITRVFGNGTRMISCKELRFKKRESQNSIIRDALEDTASSLNCPKAKGSILDRRHSTKDLLIATDDDCPATKKPNPGLVLPSTHSGEA